MTSLTGLFFSLYIPSCCIGIVCYEKLEDMLKLVNSQVVKKDSKYVVQKYIGKTYNFDNITKNTANM